MIMKVKVLHPNATIPTKAHSGDLGYDLYAVEQVEFNPGETKLVSTGIAVNFPTNLGGILKDRSSVASKQNLFVKAGVIDNGYTGEIKVLMYNSLNDYNVVATGQKIAQMILTPVYTASILVVKELDSTSRGDKGFGSSGR